MALGLAEHDRAQAEQHFAAAAAIDEPATALLRIEALIELGRTIRQQGERARARPPLREALDGAEKLRAIRLAREAEAELRAARGRPPKRAHANDELTPSERRIAELAAAGSSNREIAASLFLSIRTVETHLTSAYRRMGISSRRELPGALRAAP
jgi:DNA-binding CsgD family transcriptional regulator